MKKTLEDRREQSRILVKAKRDRLRKAGFVSVVSMVQPGYVDHVREYVRKLNEHAVENGVTTALPEEI